MNKDFKPLDDTVYHNAYWVKMWRCECVNCGSIHFIPIACFAMGKFGDYYCSCEIVSNDNT